MKFGTCIVPYWPHGYPSVAAFNAVMTKGMTALAQVGLTDLRLGAPLHNIFPDPATENWAMLNYFTEPAVRAGLSISLNPTGCPPWASEGQPAYIGSIAGWPPETPVPPAVWAGDSWWDDPAHPDIAHIHRFGDPKFAAVDAKLPPRPYLDKPPHRLPRFYEEFAGYRLTMQYENVIDSCGVENEPTGFGGEMRIDKAFVEGGPDVIRDRYFPEIVEPYVTGVRRAQPRMTIVGPEADSAEGLNRICELDDAMYRARPSLNCFDILSVHPYGDLIGGDYRKMSAFDEVLAKWKSRRLVRIGEIAGDPQALYDWTVEQIRTRSYLEGIFYGDPGFVFDAGSWPTAPSVSAVGEKFKRLFATMGAA